MVHMVAGLVVVLLARSAVAQAPLMSELMGVNGHSVLTDSELFNDAVLEMRDYHNVDWDLGNNTSSWTSSYGPTPAWSANGVHWLDIYSTWAGDGFTINTAIQFNNIDYNDWSNLATDAYNYGYTLASYYGPNAAGPGQGLISSLQIGNEMTNYNNLEYRQLYQAIANGARAADPDLKLVTAAIENTFNGTTYSKPLRVFKGSVNGQNADLTDLVDVYAIHAYAQVVGWPTWRRTFVEDPTFTSYLNRIQSVINWRDANDPTAEVWITEFGYDAYDGPLTPTGDFADWEDVTMLQQAQWMTRSWLIFSGMGINKAHMYFFKDLAAPQLHGASGLVRYDDSKKPSFYATQHLQDTLGEYRFSEKIVEISNDLYVYEYVHGDDSTDLVWVAWLPTGEDEETETEFRTVILDNLPGEVLGVERLALTASGGTPVSFTQIDADSISILLGESLAFLHISTFPVPEPGGLSIAVLGGLLVLRRRRCA